jgi:hypothetical protein
MNGRRRASSATTSLAGALSPIPLGQLSAPCALSRGAPGDDASDQVGSQMADPAPRMHGASDCLRPGALLERLRPNRMIAKEDSQCGRSD